MQLEILTPDKKVFSGEVISVTVPGKAGSFQILENHAAIISTLDNGPVKVGITDKSVQVFEIKGGAVEVLKNKVTILTPGVTEN